MKHLLRKTVSISFVSVAAIKLADQKYAKPQLFKKPVFADDDFYAHEDIIGNILKTEFEGDLKNLPEYARNKYEFQLKNRDQHIKELSDPKNEYDILVIGGGASGAGVALEASCRGLKCAVIDSYDFASGTSSRSTKLAHGGIRYFENMLKLKGDPFENYHLLKEALHERNYFLYAAPFQNKQIDLMIPSKSLFFSALYYFPGAMMYHFMYLTQLMRSDYDVSVDGPKILRKTKVANLLPNLKSMQSMYGTLMHETQMMDSRMNMNALLTSSVDNYIIGMQGATLANYTEFVDFIKNESTGKIEGAILFDKLKKKEYRVKSKVVVNCAGIQADSVRQKDDPQARQRITGARGTHLIFKQGLIPENTGIIIPHTRDGRIIFIANYLGHCLVGTTDEKCELTQHVEAPETDIEFLKEELKFILGDDINYETDLLSSWAGIRPLVRTFEEELEHSSDQQYRTMRAKIGNKLKNGLIWFGKVIHNEKKDSTAIISRNHVIEKSQSGLVSLMGGKWTTFRAMGEETVNGIIKDNPKVIEPKQELSMTRKFRLIGSYTKVETQHGLHQSFDKVGTQYEDYLVYHFDIPRDVAKNLIHSYGTASLRVVKLGKELKLNQRVHPDYPFMKAEFAYAAKYEMAEKPNDILCRRVPIALLNKELALSLLPEVVEILAKEKKWSSTQKKQELEQAINDLKFVK